MKPSAQTAISILEKLLEQTDPAMMAYWVTPNTILTLSGARAYCDGVFYHDSSTVLQGWVDELAASAKIITSVTDVYFSEAKVNKSNAGEPYASYDMVLTDGLRGVLKATELIADDGDLCLEHLSGEKLVGEIARQLSSQPVTRKYNDENLRHIAFGILVGYPDKAILGSVEEWEKNDHFAEQLIDADIRGARYYLCPQPIYSYPRHLVTDKGIQAHEKLWSTILHEFYSSGFHQNLAGNADFKRKAKQLGLYA